MEHRRTRKARASGYTDDEIVNHLASRVPDAFKAAADAGYSSTVILDALSSAYGHTLTLTPVDYDPFAPSFKWDALLQPFGIALVPPLFFLIVGTALGWALKGFQSQRAGGP